MFRKLCWAGVLWLLSGLCGCSAPNPNVRVRRLPNGFLEVDGPLAGPFRTLEELAQNACEIMTSQPGAANGLNGIEYCALHYYSPKEDAFLLSYLSDKTSGGADWENSKKSCIIPRVLNDPAHPDALILGGDHTHPHNRQFSSLDLRVSSHWPPVRFVDPATKRVWDRQLLLFHREGTGVCLSYSYDNATRIVAALRNGRWIPIGRVYNDQGSIEMMEGMDWLP